jgi:hypothetical protein
MLAATEGDPELPFALAIVAAALRARLEWLWAATRREAN